MTALFAFPRAMLAMPIAWQGWIALMIVLNAVVPLVLIETLEAKVVIATFMASATVMMVVHHFKGFVRLIGIGHFLWFPLLAWLATRLEATGGSMRAWLIALMVVNALSLVIDVYDLVRYMRGDRQIPVRG